MADLAYLEYGKRTADEPETLLKYLLAIIPIRYQMTACALPVEASRQSSSLNAIAVRNQLAYSNLEVVFSREA
jgi:hypothetical protein